MNNFHKENLQRDWGGQADFHKSGKTLQCKILYQSLGPRKQKSNATRTLLSHQNRQDEDRVQNWASGATTLLTATLISSWAVSGHATLSPSSPPYGGRLHLTAALVMTASHRKSPKSVVHGQAHSSVPLNDTCAVTK